ncbi:MAG: ABC transporter permease subunit [Alphaproteobacteria bacterium]
MAASAGRADGGRIRRGTSVGLVRFVPGLTIFLFLGPIAAGLVWTVLPAFGFLPALGGTTLSLDPWRAIFDYPGTTAAAARSLATGLSAAVLSAILVAGFVAVSHHTSWFRRFRAVLAPLLSVPHAALAIGLAFLLTPSGWIQRLLSPWATGFERPPDVMIAPDPYGWGLVAALVIKETPFLFLMTLGALGQVDHDRSLAVARSLGYRPAAAWLKAVLPQIYRQLRLPIFAVIAFSVSVVDVALIMTATPTPTLSILILRWAHDPDLTQQFLAAAGAVLQMAVAGGAIAIWILLERIAAAVGLQWVRGGARRLPQVATWSFWSGMTLAVTAGIAGLLGLAIWSVAKRWRFPDALPGSWDFGGWADRTATVAEPAATTLILGLAATAIAMALVLGCLESEQRRGQRPSDRVLLILYAPLILPQVSFLFGAQVLLVTVGLDGHWAGLIWAHLLFVLPYVFLSLSEPYRALDPRYARTATCLGLSPGRVFLRVRLPMLLRPILIAAAVGFAVSIGEYLPTVFAGAGRLTTLTTEAVALAGGGDRRTIGTYAVLQAALPLAGFLLAAGIPVLWMRFKFRGAAK